MRNFATYHERRIPKSDAIFKQRFDRIKTNSFVSIMLEQRKLTSAESLNNRFQITAIQFREL